MEGFLHSISAAASSPYAFAAYAIAALVFLFAGAKLRMAKLLLSQISSIPESERRRALEIATGTVLPTSVSPEQWIRHSRLRWLFLLLGSLLIVALALATIAILNPTKAAMEGMTSAIARLKDPDLTVEYFVATYTGANVLIGNRGQDIVIVSDLTIHWTYRECPRFKEPSVGAPIVTYRYKADLTKSAGSKLLETSDFKYGPGDVDRFLVDLNFPDYGVYTVWLTFQYRKLGSQAGQVYETSHLDREVCEKF